MSGPGAGSSFLFLLMRFVNAPASAKVLNVATNPRRWRRSRSRVRVVAHRHPHGAGNVAGSLVGWRLALRHGAGFVRGVFVVVVSVLSLRTGHDAYFR